MAGRHPVLAGRLIRVVVVDDHPVVRDGVAAQLRLNRDIAIIGHAARGDEAVDVCSKERPDIVLLDLRLPDVVAADVVPRIHAASPGTKVLLFTAFPDHPAVAPTLAAGACGLLIKDITGPALRDALRDVAQRGALNSTIPEPAAMPITPREYDVLRLVAAGHTNQEIGVELGISLNTAKAYLANVMHKLSARNRAQVITNARTRGLL